MDFSRGWIAVVEGLPYILKGVWVTMMVVAGALAVGMMLGILLSIAQVYGHQNLRRVVVVYVWFFRGIPLLVLLFLFYFGLLTALEIELSPSKIKLH